jgi:peptidoglycan hydrolase-like protein with peptidoglycan-binding domain
MEIQQALIDKGFHSGPPSGKWGSEWVAALKQFQQAQNLKVDGKLGALSLIALGLGPKREPMTQLAGKPESNP